MPIKKYFFGLSLVLLVEQTVDSLENPLDARFLAQSIGNERCNCMQSKQ